ncbi:MAG TPA: DEAD/DEAH box helicase, partial [Arenibaculum sp.]|nr:DEAD/DEAH box helicase [Arenibaculum sp.]
MDVIARTVIPRHAVPEVLVGGDRLSPMQAALLETDSVCTVAGAPTGAGKSFVFRRAVERGERVLFVVPTRRLAENQAAGIRADLRDAGWPERDVAEKVAMFTSDESARLRASGVTRITLHRLAKLPQLRPNERGEIIFATPEAVSWLLMHPHMGDGLGDVGAATLMRSFDRLVFDEFHLIQPRGFGLVSLCAGLAAHGPWRDGKDGNRSRAKVSLLSATPLDIRPVMRRLGVPLERSDIIDETIVEDGGRVLHGDVTLEFAVAESPLELARELAPEIGALPDGQVAVVLYDALKDLQRDLDGLLDLAERLDLLGS